MNRNRYRLLFNELIGAWVVVPETARARGKRSSRGARLAALAGTLATALSAAYSPALLAGRELPVAASNFIDARLSGTAAVTRAANNMVIRQTGNAVLLNWQSFDIARGYSVHFDQSNSAMRAINVVVPGGPRSEIDGALTANGQVFIFNQAGILFGANAQVDVGGLVGSTLKLNDALLMQALNSLGSQGAAFERHTDAERAGLATGDISVANGARIVAAKNGRVLLAAPNVTNGGHIAAEEGQVILAAGEKVYIADPLDSRLRGFLVEVDNGGQVTTEAASELLSERGNVTLVGLNIRHAGAARATTSVTLNGSVYLKARDTVQARNSDAMFPDAGELPSGQTIPVGQRTGRVELAAGSVIDVSLDGATKSGTVRDDAAFHPSEVNLFGRQIVLEDAEVDAVGALIHAPSGTLRMQARQGLGAGAQPLVHLGRGSVIDLSGVDAEVDAGKEIVQIELRGDEVKDSPLLRDAIYGRALFGKTMWVNTRQGTQLVDVSGYLGSIERTVDEKSVTGGTFLVTSDGDVRMHADSSVDLSGGTVTYRAGRVNYSLVRSVDGRTQAVETALADRVYSSVTDRSRTVDRIVEGRDAGRMEVTASSMVLDGRITAARTVGPTQRELGMRWTGPGASETVGAPQAGQLLLTLTNAQAPQDVRFVAVAPTREIDQTSALPGELLLRSDLFSAGGIGVFELKGAGHVTLPEDVRLDIGPAARIEVDEQNGSSAWVDGSKFSISATSMLIEGTIDAAGGDVTLKTDAMNDRLASLAGRNITFGSKAAISTAGRWVSDVRSDADGHIAHNGGSITVEAHGNLVVPVGASLDVSAGGWRSAAGTVSIGDAGAIALLAGSRIDDSSGIGGTVGDFYGTLTLGGHLSGYAAMWRDKVGGSGTLTLRSSEIVIDGGTRNEGGVLYLGNELFTDYGFDDIRIEGSNGVTIGRIDGGAFALAPQVLARRLDALPAASQTTLSGVATGLLERGYRDRGMALEFEALSTTRGAVRLLEDASVMVDAGGAITFTGNRSVEVDGALIAPGGSITLDQKQPARVDSDNGDFYTGATVFVGEHAKLDVSGTFVATPGLSYVDGTVLDGGDITLAARRGYLIVQAGAELRSDGTSAMLRQRVQGGSAATRVYSNGGHIALSAREGLYADPLLSAKAGGSGAVGGSLLVRLDQQGEAWADAMYLPATLTGPRTLDIVQDGGALAGDLSGVIGSFLNHRLSSNEETLKYAGRGVLAASALTSSGIMDLELGVVGSSSSHGSLRFASDVSLMLAGRLDIDAANIVGRNGADVKLGAAVIDWHNVGSEQQHHAQATSAVVTDGTLTLHADLLSVRGNLAASGFSEVGLSATGDLRASAAPAYFSAGATFATSGNLTLTAAQVYPTTASKYAFEVQNNPLGQLTVQHSGAMPGMVYSALGHLTLAAPTVVQAGRVVAPLGAIDLLSQNIVRSNGLMSSAVRTGVSGGEVKLAAGSVTSVSASGMLLPYGQTTLSGREWAYLITGMDSLDLDATPQPAVTVNADKVNIEGADGNKAAARVDLSGGGDLQAWEWIPGTGGSKDVLSRTETADTYAIIPSLGSSWAPYDAAMYSEDANGLRPGDGISILSGVDGLPAGTYALLPARYALLPGAYLVRVSRGDRSVVAGQSLTYADGSRLVAAQDARITGAGAAAAGGKSYVAQIYSSEQVGSLAEYKLSNTGDLFDGGRSTGDAGRLSLQVGSALQLAGVLDTAHAASARGAQVDITARALAVLGGGATARAGEVGVDVAQLNALNVESLVLGGSRTGRDPDSGVTVLDVRDTDATGLTRYGAATVRIDTDGEVLGAPDLVIAARDAVTVEAGSRIVASGNASPEVLRLAGSGAAADGALLRVSNGDVALPQRDAPAGQRGVLTLGAGAEIIGQSVVLDSTRDTVNHGARIGSSGEGGGALALTGSTISVGEVDGAVGGLVFDSAALAALGNPSSLTLKSYGSLNLYGEVALGSSAVKTLTLDAAGIAGLNNEGVVQRIAADTVVLTNSNPAAGGATAAAGGGTLQIDAGSVVFGATPARQADMAGFAVNGFDAVGIDAARDVQLAGSSHFQLAADAVTVTTPRVSASAGADTRIDASGALALNGQGGVAGGGGVGGVLQVNARTIDMDTLIDLPSGRVALNAEQDVTVGGRILAAGAVKDYLGRKVATPGGSIALSSHSGNIDVEAGALLDVSAAAAGGDAGSVSLSAPQGDVRVAAGTLKAGASGGGTGGEFSVDLKSAASLDGFAALGSDFTKRWTARVREGDTRIDAGLKATEIVIGADAGSLTVAGTLDASGADQGGRIDLAARRAAGHADGGSGAGDLLLTGTAVLDARATTWMAGADGTRGEGGTVVLEASPEAAGGESGTARGGIIRVADGARIDVGTTSATVDGVAVASAARRGEVTLRGERVGNSAVAVEGNLGATVSGARNLFIEGTRIYSGSTLNMATAHTHSTAFMTVANVAALRSALGLPADDADGGTQVHIRPHVEFRTDSNFTIAATDLATRTYLGGTEAGTLTVRAGGTLTVSGTLSDGFGNARSGGVTNVLGAQTRTGLANTTYFDLGTRDTAWSIRLASGADTSASNALSLRSLAELEVGDTGDLLVRNNVQVRTGAGSIEVAAGRDLTLEGAMSAIYTAGYQDARGTAFDATTQLNIGGTGNRRAAYATNGGDVSVLAQRSVLAAESTQTLGNWLFRQGRLADDGTLIAGSNARNSTWYARMDLFGGGFATFGGGDIRLRAGSDVRHVALATATNGRLLGEGGTLPDATNLKVLGGGSIEVIAGGDIGSASFYVDRGRLLVQAGGDFGSARRDGAGSILAIGDASAVLRAAGDIDLETIASATMVEQLVAARASNRETYFAIYDTDNRVDILSYSGSASLANSARPWGSLALWIGNRPLLPASLSLVAMGGDVQVGGMVLVPSTYNDLLIAARDNIKLKTADGGVSQIKIADSAPSAVPSVIKPALPADRNDPNSILSRLLGSSLVSGYDAHNAALNEARTVVPVRLVAETGDIVVPSAESTLPLALYSPQQVLVDAAGDIINLTVRAQHFSADDVTRVRAGGDIRFTEVAPGGVPSGKETEGIILGGAGRLEVIAGGDVDLANSFGIVTRGNYDNPALPEQGASILVQAGSRDFDGHGLLAFLRGQSVDAFDQALLAVTGASSVDEFLVVSERDDAQTVRFKTDALRVRTEERARLAVLHERLDSAAIGWMRSEHGAIGSDAEVLAAYGTLPVAAREAFLENQRPLLSALLSVSLRYAGRLGDLLSKGEDGFKPGYEAIAAAFPTLSAGGINLFASQVKSEQGGDIDLFAPGGPINVGVAGSGASAVEASRQGVFAVGAGEINAIAGDDFQVGPSRVLTLGGGDIQIWTSEGDIDAGKGSQTAAATPPPRVIIRGDTVVLDVSASVSGSGVRTLQKSPDVDLSDTEIWVFAPKGAVIAQDAGFGGPNIFIAAREVIGDNIKGSVSGSVTVPAVAAPAPAIAPPSEANKAADESQSAAASGAREEREKSSILTVELVGLGEDVAVRCDPEREACPE